MHACARARAYVCVCVCVCVSVCDCANFARKVVVCGMCKTMRARALSHCINELFVVVYAGVSILNNARTAKHSVDKHHSNFTVLFAGGAAVQVAERQGLLHLIVVLPPGSGKVLETNFLSFRRVAVCRLQIIYTICCFSL